MIRIRNFATKFVLCEHAWQTFTKKIKKDIPLIVYDAGRKSGVITCQKAFSAYEVRRCLRLPV